MNFEQLNLFALFPELASSEQKQTSESKKPKMRVQLKPSIVHKNTINEKPVAEENLLFEEEPVVAQEPMPASISLNKRGRKSYKEVYTAIELINVPEDEILTKKLYYSISEVAGWFNVTTSQVRFWENEFDILQPRKNRKGDRLFRVEDIKNLQLIYYLLRNRKFSIEGAKEFLKANKHKAELHLQLIESLSKLRSFLINLKANLIS
jgi:DNA-binding transcriptional MerR regulator